MQLLVFNRSLTQGLMAGLLVLASATACSRSDRSETGTNNTGVVQDTTNSASGQTGTAGPSVSGGADTAATAAPPAETRRSDGDSTAAGYRAMEEDTAAVVQDSGVRHHTSAVVDTAAAGYSEMARDTSTTADQIDTAAVNDTAGTPLARMDSTEGAPSANAEVAIAADTTDSAGRIRPPEDSTEILGEVTTNSTADVATADTAESEPIRPPEDSTEILSSVNSNETADEEPVAEQETVATQETVAAAEARTDEVGAAAMGGTVTGSAAVALMTRQGFPCSVVDPESNEAVRWDMSNTPVTLNPCGLGSMNLSKVWTASERGSGAAGQ